MQLGSMALRQTWRPALYIAAAIVILAAPLFLSDFRLNLLAKFLTFAIVAFGLDLMWGYTGILSLGHGVFFGLGAYAMAMYLKLTASGGKIPDFMNWSGLTKLPWFWEPFQYFGVALIMGILLPVILALFLGYFTFRNRIRGVYFTIMTQALVIIMVTLFIGQQAYTGGTNGITGFQTIFGYRLADSSTKTMLYLITAVVMILVFLFCRWLVNSRLGKVLRAIRDGENRARFLGYNPAVYQLFVFGVSAGLSGLAGMLFVLHVGIISPTMMGILPSIEMVLWVAVGGRGTLIGAGIGAIGFSWAKSLFSENYPEVWSYFMGAMFIVIVVFMPAGALGSIPKLFERIKGRLTRNERKGYDSVLGKSDGGI